MGRIASFRQVDERYPVLRFVAAVCSGIGVLLMLLGVLLLVAGLYLSLQVQQPGQFQPLQTFGILVPVVWSFGLFISGIQLLALGSVYRLAIHLEENTRATAQALDRLRGELEPRVVLNPPPLFPS